MRLVYIAVLGFFALSLGFGQIYNPSSAPAPLTFASGLTNTAGNVTADTGTGKAGGQTIIGGLASSDVLTLKGTSANASGYIPAITLTYGNNGGSIGLSLFENGLVGIGNSGTFGLQSFGANNDSFESNIYYNGSNNVYRVANSAGMLQFNGGNILLRTAPLGAAGATANLTTGLQINSNGSVTVGSTGVAINRIAKYTATLTPTAVAANTCAEQTFTVTGIATSDIVYSNKPTAQAGLGVSGIRASAANTVGINYCNVTASSITPTAETYSFGVIQ